MCLLSYYPPGVMPVREHLENGARLNPQGCGFALGYTAIRSSEVNGKRFGVTVAEDSGRIRAVAANRSLPRSVRQEINEMAQRVIDGEFDASPEESQAWAESPEGRETFRQLATDSVFGGMVRDMEKRSEGTGPGR
jgi:hypothetical protein